MCKSVHAFIKPAFVLVYVGLLAGCASTPTDSTVSTVGKAVCDIYILLSMCVQDLNVDGTVDMVYFTDTKEVFMYQEGRQSVVAQVMPFHRCAVPLSAKMQATTNRILNREDLSFTEEVAITRDLITSYSAAKPTIDACNARFESSASVDATREDTFSTFEPDWATE